MHGTCLTGNGHNVRLPLPRAPLMLYNELGGFQAIHLWHHQIHQDKGVVLLLTLFHSLQGMGFDQCTFSQPAKCESLISCNLGAMKLAGNTASSAGLLRVRSW